MSNRSETKKSTDRTKRVRIVEDDNTNSTKSAASGGDEKPPPSIELARGQLKSYVESLQPHMRTRLELLANSILSSFATYYRKNQTYTIQKNNPEFIPGSAQISITLSIVEGVKEDPGFQGLVRKTAEVVNQCRKLLREPILESTKMNVDKLLSNAQYELVKSLPDIAELIVDDVYYGHTNKPISKHMAVADLMDKHADDVLPIFKLNLETFKTKYCEVHQLEFFPRPLLNPSLRRLNANSQAATTQGEAELAEDLRGGTTLNDNSMSSNNDPGLTSPAPAPAPTYAAVATVTQTVGNTNQTPQTSLAAAAASNQQQQTDRLRQIIEATLTTQEKEVLNTLGTEQRAVLDNVMALSLSNTFNQSVPPDNPYNTATPRGHINNNNTTQLIQQVNNPSGDDGTGDQNMEDTNNNSGNHNNNGGGGNNNIGGGNNNFIFNSDLFHYEQGGMIRRILLATIKGAIVNPINLYLEQDKLAKKASHLINVAKKQTLTDVADKTAEALEEEAAVDPKIVRVMIQDGAETALKKLMQQQKNSKNKSGGGNDTTASTKKQSPQQSNRQRSPSPGGRGNKGRGNQGRGRGRAGRGTGDGRGRNGKQSSKRSSKKSNDVKKRGRSKSPGTSRGK